MQTFPVVHTAVSAVLPHSTDSANKRGERSNAAPWQAPASQIKSKVDGNCRRLPNRRQSGSEDRSNSNRIDTSLGRHLIAQRKQSFNRPTANAGVEGDSPRLSLGVSKGVFSSEREYPLCPAAAPKGAATPPRGARKLPSQMHRVQKKSRPFRQLPFTSLPETPPAA